jgi:hypothetical protein
VLVWPEANPSVFTTTIAPQHVLGIFHGRNEAEVVIDPFALRGRSALTAGIPATDARVVRLVEEYVAMRQAKKTA